MDASEAPYFVDLVRDQLNQRVGETEFNREGLRIYTSLDVDLQKAAAEAVEVGMRNVDEQVLKLHTPRRSAKTAAPPKPTKLHFSILKLLLLRSIRTPAKCLPLSADATMATVS